MRRKPLVLGLSVASVVAITAPGWDALIDLWASPGSCRSSAKLAAAGSAAAVLAFVASAIGHHQHAAFGAGRRASWASRGLEDCGLVSGGARRIASVIAGAAEEACTTGAEAGAAA